MKEKIKYTLEYNIKTSPKVLYERLSTPSGLSEWFAEDVNIQKDVYTFIWDGSKEQAELITKKAEKFVKFRWIEDSPKYYFEFKIDIDDLTGGLALNITDFDFEEDIEEAKEMWDYHVNDLKHALGII